MQRGWFLLAAVVVFATARVEAVDPVNAFAGFFDGNIETIDFSTVPDGSAIGVVLTATNAVDFKANLFELSDSAVNATVGPPASVITPIDIDFASPVDIVAFIAVPVAGTTDIDILFKGPNESLNFPLGGAGAIVGGRDFDGITGITITPKGGGEVVLINTFSIEDLRPTLLVTPVAQPIDFGTIAAGDTVTRDITIRNVAGAFAPLKLTSITISGSADFSVTTNPAPATVAPGASVIATITYAPLSGGVDNATVSVHSDAAAPSPRTRTLTGTALGTPVIDVDPNAVNFGQVFQGSSAIRTLTISNTGDAELRLTDITMSNGDDPPKNDFDIPILSGGLPPAFPVIVPVGDSVTLSIVYSPSNMGMDSDRVEISSNDPASPLVQVPLSGTGVPQRIPEISVTPDSHSYGTKVIGTGSSRTINIKNDGNGVLSVPSVVLGGASRSQFVLSGAPGMGGALLDPGESMRVTVTYRPNQIGSHRANVVITSNDADEGSVTIDLSGSARIDQAPDIAVSPETVDFGDVFVGASATQQVTITNEGALLLTVSNVAIGDGSDPSFSLGDVTLPIELASGGSIPIDVSFTPGDLGVVEGSLVIESDDEDESPVSVALIGEGTPTPAPEIAVDTDPSLNFGQVLVGSSETRTATIRNTGVAILDVTSIGLSEGTSSEFVYSGPESVSLVPGAELPLDVTFSPTDAGFEGGNLVIMSADPDEPVVEVSLSGTGTVEPAAKIDIETAPALAYGQVQIGSPMTKSFQIHNAGSATLQVTAIALSAGSSADYSISNGPVLPVDIAPGALVEVAVDYNPSNLGFDSGAVSVESDDADNPSLSVSLTGVGVEQTVPAIEVAPDALAYGDVEVGSASTMSITVTNAGTANLNVSAVGLGDGSSDQFALGDLVLPVSLAPGGGQMTIDVSFAPTAAGAANATVVIESDDPDNPAVTVSANGSGVEAPPAPEVGVDPAELAFGDVEVGTSSALGLTVTNTGTAPLTVTRIGIGAESSGNYSLSGVPEASTSILMVGGDAGPTSGADPAIFGILVEAYGEAAALGDPGVFYMQGEASATGDEALVDVLFISSTLSSGTVRDKFEDSATPTLNYEQALMHDNQAGNFFMSDGGATSDGHTQLDILAPGHPLAAGLEGTVDVYTEPQVISAGTPPLAPGVTAIAQATTDASLQGIFAAEAGAELLGDGSDGMPATAAARRVMFFLENNGGNFLTDDGRALLLAAVDWLAQPAVAVIEPGDSVMVDVTYSPDAEATDTGTVQIESDGGNVSVPMSGTGVPGAVMQIRISPPSVDFGGTLVGTTGSADVTIRNVGTANLDLSGVAIGVGSSQSFNITAAPPTLSVAPGTQTTLKVSYTPIGVLADSGTLRVASNDGKRPKVSVSLFGFGKADSSTPAFKRGDANADSTVDISDVVKTLMFLFGGGSEPECYDAADANDDGTVDVSDGLFTVTRLFGGSDLDAPQPPLASTCAIDASADDLPDCSYPLDSCGI